MGTAILLLCPAPARESLHMRNRELAVHSRFPIRRNEKIRHHPIEEEFRKGLGCPQCGKHPKKPEKADPQISGGEFGKSTSEPESACPFALMVQKDQSLKSRGHHQLWPQDTRPIAFFLIDLLDSLFPHQQPSPLRRQASQERPAQNPISDPVVDAGVPE